MMKTRFLLIIVIGLFFSGCKYFRNNQAKDAENIKALESQIFSETDMRINIQIADSVIASYAEYAENYPEDSLSPEFLFKAGEISRNINKASQANKYFAMTYEKYPDYDKAPLCLFFQAVVYEDLLKDFNMAKEYYSLFVSKYPEHEFADDAQMLMENLGKTPEQIIQEFEARQAQANDSLM